MTFVVAEIALQTQGTSRDDVLGHTDRLAIDILNNIGGHPWIMMDDDITRNHGPGSHLADDQGFLYICKRRYVFGGPTKEGPEAKPGQEVQKIEADNAQG